MWFVWSISGKLIHGILGVLQRIAFPMARHRPIFNRCRPLTDRDDVLDLPPSITDETRLFRSTDRALRPKMVKQLFLEHASGLNK
jgi:hypothetical protein